MISGVFPFLRRRALDSGSHLVATARNFAALFPSYQRPPPPLRLRDPRSTFGRLRPGRQPTVQLTALLARNDGRLAGATQGTGERTAAWSAQTHEGSPAPDDQVIIIPYDECARTVEAASDRHSVEVSLPSDHDGPPARAQGGSRAA